LSTSKMTATDILQNNNNKKAKLRNVKTVREDFCIESGGLVEIDPPFRIDEGDYDVLRELCSHQNRSATHFRQPGEYVNVKKMACLRDGDEDRRVRKLTVSSLVAGWHVRSVGEMPDVIGSLDALEILDLTDAGNVAVPSCIGALKQLREIHLPNRGTELPEEIGALTKLEVLQHHHERKEWFKSYEGYDRLPDTMKNLTNLRVLKIKVAALPDWIGDLTNLEHLSVMRSQMARIPNSIGKLRKLKFFELECVWDLSFPDSIGNLTSLEELYLSAGGLESLPASICNLVNLKKFEVESSKFQRWNEGIESLVKLEELHIRGISDPTKPKAFLRSFRGLPESIGTLANVRSLDFSHSNLENLPATCCNFVELKTLKLTNTSLNKLPEGIGKLVNLERLYAGFMPTLSRLPDSIGDLASLKELDLRSAVLKSLPDSFCNLANLRKLNLSETRALKRLPDGFEDLTNLETLYLRDSGVVAVSDSDGSGLRTSRWDTPASLQASARRECERLHEQLRGLPNLRELGIGGSKKHPGRFWQEAVLETVYASASLLFLNTGVARLDDDVNAAISRCLRWKQAKFRILKQCRRDRLYFPPHALWPLILNQAYYAYEKRYRFPREVEKRWVRGGGQTAGTLWERRDTASDDIFELLVEFGPRFLRSEPSPEEEHPPSASRGEDGENGNINNNSKKKKKGYSIGVLSRSGTRYVIEHDLDRISS